VQQGYKVGIIDLTDGEPTPGSPGPEVRLAEAKRAAVTLGATCAAARQKSGARTDEMPNVTALAVERERIGM